MNLRRVNPLGLVRRPLRDTAWAQDFKAETKWLELRLGQVNQPDAVRRKWRPPRLSEGKLYPPKRFVKKNYPKRRTFIQNYSYPAVYPKVILISLIKSFSFDYYSRLH